MIGAAFRGRDEMSWDVRHVASEWMIRIGALFYIPQRRAAAAGASGRM
jgi:hypothetical protein